MLEWLSPSNKLEFDERGRYHLLNYRRELDPPLSPEDAAWVDAILRAQGLR